MEQAIQILSKIGTATWKFIKKCGRGIRNTVTFATDWKYRHDVLEEHWNWKTKLLTIVLVPAIIFGGLMSIERDKQAVKVKDKTGQIKTEMVGTSTWGMWYDCMMEQIDVGRETNFSIITGSCVIDSGKTDADGNVVWVKVKNDIASGDFDGQ